jgi:hypothetical protein
MNSLEQYSKYLMKRFPTFELSYETIAHKKVFTSYDIAVAIPNGRKFFAWFSFYKDTDVCYLMELNKDKKIIKTTIEKTPFHSSLSLGTIFYGTIVNLKQDNNSNSNKEENKDENRAFLIEDIHYYKGISMKNILFGEKLGYIESIFRNNLSQKSKSPQDVIFYLPFIWCMNLQDTADTTESDILAQFENHRVKIPYPVHHLQLRKLTEISPFLNVNLNTISTKANIIKVEKGIAEKHIQNKIFECNYQSKQYKFPTVFHVCADIQYDIYHLYAYGKNKSLVYYNVACIPNIRTSVFMNSLFRNIRENKNIDYIEESDNEDDFENIAEDKYVDLNKSFNIVCVFNSKFKKWVPLKIADENTRVIHISNL